MHHGVLPALGETGMIMGRLEGALWLKPFLVFTWYAPDTCLWGRDPGIPENPPTLPSPGLDAPRPTRGQPEWLDQFIPLKNLMMSVKSMLLSRMISLYVSTRARAMNKTKCSDEMCLATQITSHTANTSSYGSSGDRKELALNSQGAQLDGNTWSLL